MNAKEYLEKVGIMEKQFDSMLENYEALKSVAESTITKLSGMPHAGDNYRKIENFAVKLVCLEEKIQAEAQKLFDIKNEALYYISLLEDPAERSILRKHYILGNSYRKIACESNYARAYVYDKKDDALENLSKILNEKIPNKN